MGVGQGEPPAYGHIVAGGDVDHIVLLRVSAFRGAF